MLPPLGEGHGQRGREFQAWIALCLAYGCRRYVELGWGAGATAQFAQDAGMSVISVDMVPQPVGGRRAGILYVVGNSWDPLSVEKVLDVFDGGPDAVFIDAEHNFDCPRKDFEAWWPHTGRLMGFHDIEAFDSGVLWREVSRGHLSLEIASRDLASQAAWEARGGVAAGIGVLFKDS